MCVQTACTGVNKPLAADLPRCLKAISRLYACPTTLKLASTKRQGVGQVHEVVLTFDTSITWEECSTSHFTGLKTHEKPNSSRRHQLPNQNTHKLDNSKIHKLINSKTHQFKITSTQKLINSSIQRPISPKLINSSTPKLINSSTPKNISSKNHQLINSKT